MARFALLDRATAGQAERPIENVVEAATAADLPPWQDHVADPSGVAIIGGTWDGAAFRAPGPGALPVPEEVTLFQGRTMMRQMPNPKGSGTLFDAVDAYVNANVSAHPEFYEAWNYSNHILRHGGIVSSLAPAFGLTDAQIDALFIAASQIQG